ncbi:MAG TPA: hypothetical protein VHY08_02140 [Bacillota bacterium]|nr:hypothetical protein [Bacillota bacterium]
MPKQKTKHLWADPNREGQSKDKQGRFCSKCGNPVTKFRILKSVNLCEFCVNEIQRKRDGITSCRSCGKIAPEEIREHNGFCKLCVCPACGKPDPDYVRKTGLCFHCAQTFKEFCRGCGKEAPAQIRQNKGWCDECAKTRPVQKKDKKSYFTMKKEKKT